MVIYTDGSVHRHGSVPHSEEINPQEHGKSIPTTPAQGMRVETEALTQALMLQ